MRVRRIERNRRKRRRIYQEAGSLGPAALGALVAASVASKIKNAEENDEEGNKRRIQQGRGGINPIFVDVKKGSKSPRI